MNVGRIVRTVRYLKLCQIWFQVWRRVQRRFEAHPKCAADELPQFTFLNLTATPKGWNDESLDMLWRYNLHYFDWIGNRVEHVERVEMGGKPQIGTNRHKSEDEFCEDKCGFVVNSRVEHVDHVEFLERWIRENPRGSVPGWDPYPTSLRIVNWVKWLENCVGRRMDTKPQIGTNRHKSEDEFCEDKCGFVVKGKFIEGSIRAQVEWLGGHVEWHIMANHLLANLKALIIGNRYLGLDYARWMRLYREQIAEQVLPDGGHFERSVMYHAIILEDVLDVIRFCGDEATWLRPVVAKMLSYLVNMTGPDGKIAMFNDAADGIAKPTKWLCEYARSLGIEAPEPEPFVDFPDTGYTRMTAGDFVLFVDSGAIGPDYQPGHAHADTLTYELYWKGRKIVTDTGTSEYRGKRRAYERSTAAHNVVEINGRNSSEVWSSHRVGARARIVERVVEPGGVMAAHDGYGEKVGRVLTLTEEGLTVAEKVEGRGECVTRVHLTEEGVYRLECVGERGNLGPQIDTNQHKPGDGICEDQCGFAVKDKVGGGEEKWEREEFEYAVEFGKLEKGMCLIWRFDAPGEFTYTIKAKNDILYLQPQRTQRSC